MSEEDEIQIVGRADSADSFRQLQAMYGAPAFVRRARQVEDAWTALLERCSRQRDEWLTMPRLRVGMLKALAGEWVELRPLIVDDHSLLALECLHDALSPRLRVSVAQTRSLRQLRIALAELCMSLELFNGRWMRYLEQLDLGSVNAQRDAYNRWYVLEKECAVRSPRLAREGFSRLVPLTVADVLRAQPLLPVPRLAG